MLAFWHKLSRARFEICTELETRCASSALPNLLCNASPAVCDTAYSEKPSASPKQLRSTMSCSLSFDPVAWAEINFCLGL